MKEYSFCIFCNQKRRKSHFIRGCTFCCFSKSYGDNTYNFQKTKKHGKCFFTIRATYFLELKKLEYTVTITTNVLERVNKFGLSMYKEYTFNKNYDNIEPKYINKTKDAVLKKAKGYLLYV